MTDMKRLVEEAGQRAALAAGKAAVMRTIDDLALSPEEKAKREAARSRARKVLMLQVAVGVVAAVALLVAAVGVLAQLWVYGLGLVVLLAVGGGAYAWLRPKLAALRARAAARLAARQAAQAEARARLEASQRERAAAEAAAMAQQKLDAELAALKKRAQQ